MVLAVSKKVSCMDIETEGWWTVCPAAIAIAKFEFKCFLWGFFGSLLQLYIHEFFNFKIAHGIADYFTHSQILILPFKIDSQNKYNMKMMPPLLLPFSFFFVWYFVKLKNLELKPCAFRFCTRSENYSKLIWGITSFSSLSLCEPQDNLQICLKDFRHIVQRLKSKRNWSEIKTKPIPSFANKEKKIDTRFLRMKWKILQKPMNKIDKRNRKEIR